MNALSPRLRRPATAAVAPATSAVSAPRLVVPPAVALAARSATSAASKATLPATAPRAVAPTAVKVARAVRAASVVAVAASVAPRVVTEVLARPPATHAVASAT